MQAIIGALVGDAAGGTLEFMGKIKPDMARRAMTMPGGGVMSLAPGQITDDGELTLTLFRHIWPYRDGMGIPRTNMTRAHAEWYDSNPFDMGSTCGNAFKRASRVVSKTPPGESLNYEEYESYEAFVKEANAESEANGALMRSTAIATWAAFCHEPTIHHATLGAKVDAELSHPNEICQEVNAIYVLAVVFLLLDYTPEETLQEVTEYVTNKVKSEKVRKWFFEESLDIDPLNCQIDIGHVRYGFVLAMYFLRHPEISYEDAIYQTLIKGGDTDTNAAIVGGLVGTYSEPPKYMLEPVLKFDCTKEGQIRPKQFGVKYVLEKYINERYKDIAL
jgi:ADP-ribosyl-[dinitrogen reductase] hydrolase